jgi:hypothetical protein
VDAGIPVLHTVMAIVDNDLKSTFIPGLARLRHDLYLDRSRFGLLRLFCYFVFDFRDISVSTHVILGIYVGTPSLELLKLLHDPQLVLLKHGKYLGFEAGEELVEGTLDDLLVDYFEVLLQLSIADLNTVK